MKPGKLLTKEYLEEHFVNQKKSERVIAAELGIKSPNSVRHWLRKHGISRGPIRSASTYLTREYLQEHYINQQKSLKEIATQVGIRGRSTVRRALIRHGIKVREDFLYSKQRRISWGIRRTGCGDISGRFWASIVMNARYRTLECDITPESVWNLFLQQDCRCALSGIPLRFNQPGEQQTMTTASLDRIDSSKGYIKGNVQWVHKIVQKMKWELSQEAFVQMCRLVSNNRSDIQ